MSESATNRSQLSDEFRNSKFAELRFALERAGGPPAKWFQYDARVAWIITSIAFDSPLLALGSGEDCSLLRNLPEPTESNSLTKNTSDEENCCHPAWSSTRGVVLPSRASCKSASLASVPTCSLMISGIK